MHLNFLPPQVINVFANVNGVKHVLRLGFTSASSLSVVTLSWWKRRGPWLTSQLHVEILVLAMEVALSGRWGGTQRADLRTVELTLPPRA